MIITVASLVAAGIAPTQARVFAEPLSAACARFAIHTPARIAAFLGQCSMESAGFTRLEENLYYTTPERVRAVFPSRVPSLADAARLKQLFEIHFDAGYLFGPGRTSAWGIEEEFDQQEDEGNICPACNEKEGESK